MSPTLSPGLTRARARNEAPHECIRLRPHCIEDITRSFRERTSAVIEVTTIKGRKLGYAGTAEDQGTGEINHLFVGPGNKEGTIVRYRLGREGISFSGGYMDVRTIRATDSYRKGDRPFHRYNRILNAMGMKVE